MKIKDLRIGNIVWHSGEYKGYRYSEVIGFLDAEYVVVLEHFREDREDMVFKRPLAIEAVQGLPLTSRILKDNGFKSNRYNNIEKDGKKLGLFRSAENEKVFLRLQLYDSRKVFKYVHEFQNFLNLIGLDDELKIE